KTTQFGRGVSCRSCNLTTWVTLHSNATGLSPTRGAATFLDATGVSPARVNSLTCGATVAELAFIAPASAMVARFHTNSPVLSALRSVSLRPLLEKPITGGLYAKALKKLYGARLKFPAPSWVDIQPMGRGPMMA